jgi:hypothetical protein
VTILGGHADYGYDLNINTFDDEGQIENAYVLVQLKATDCLSFDAKTGEIKHRIDKKDIALWENEPFPVYLVVFDVVQRRAHAVYVQEYLEKVGISAEIMKYESLGIRLRPQKVTKRTIRQWRATKNEILKDIGAIRRVKKGHV